MLTREKKRIPHRLAKEPLLEAVWELRFQSDADTVENVLPGVIFDKLAGSFEAPVRLAAADIPSAARAQQPMLNYTPAFRSDGINEKAPLSIQIAPRAVTLNCRKPYLGWGKFKSEILILAEVVRTTGLIAAIERFSLKYVDLIPASYPDYLAPLDGRFDLGGYQLGGSPLQIASQFPEDNFVHVITLLAPAIVKTAHTTDEGLLVNIDTIFSAISVNFWERFGALLDQAHDLNHALFFGILTQETIEQLKPESDLGGAPQ